MRGKENAPFALCILGALIILINGLWIASNGGPIVLSAYPVSSVDALKASTGFWGRIAFGLRGLVEGPLIAVWLIVAVMDLLCAIMLYMRPERHSVWAPLFVLFSLFSVPIGGGFVIGLILAVVGGVACFELPKPFGDTFTGKIVRAVRLDSTLYESVAKDIGLLRTAALTLIVVNFLSGLGNALYLYNVGLVQSASANTLFRILLLGEILWGVPVISGMVAYIGIAIVKWLIFSVIIYFFGVRLAGKAVEFDEVAKILAFAYVPVSLQVFLPLVFLRMPMLFVEWPLTIYFLTNLWMVLALIAGLKQRMDIPIRKALGVVILAGTIYWLINYKFLIPALNVPGIQFVFQPSELMLPLITVALLFAALLGAFTRR